VDILDEVLARVRLGGTLLYHYELTTPWSVAIPTMPDALFHYLSRGSALVCFAGGRELRMKEGDFVLVARGEAHVVCSDRKTRPFPLGEMDRSPAHLGVVRHGGGGKPCSTMICGYFHLARPPRSGVLELLPSVLHLEQSANAEWLETILRRMVSESAHERPGQQAVVSRMTEVLFVEILRSWIESLRPGKGGWLGALRDAHIGKALQLLHEKPGEPWTVRDVGRRVGLCRSAFAARFTELVGQPMLRYLIARRMDEAATLLESSDHGIAEVAGCVGYDTASAFSKLFTRHYGLSPSGYRALYRRSAAGAPWSAPPRSPDDSGLRRQRAGIGTWTARAAHASGRSNPTR
jgi:AraC-like DNA-binding protein